MILIAIGSNLPSQFGSPLHACQEALSRFALKTITILDLSRWWETAPVPVSDQPWYVNAVAAVSTKLPSSALLTQLHTIEQDMGRVRTVRNAARIIDLDLIAYHDEISGSDPCLPHPRMAQRAFVLRPLADVAPRWRHPVTGYSIQDMIAALPNEQGIRLLAKQPVS